MVSVCHSAKKGFRELCLFLYFEFTWKKTPGTKDCFTSGGKLVCSLRIEQVFISYQQHTGFCWVQPGRNKSFHQCSLMTGTKHQTHQATGGVSILCISRARLPISAGDALTQQDRTSADSTQSPDSAATHSNAGRDLPVTDLAHCYTRWKSRGGLVGRGLFGLVFLLNPIITLLTSSCAHS